MEITFLGTSAAIPTSTRGLPSIHVKNGNTSVLLDCGDGTTKKMIEGKKSIYKIDAILFSHLHNDHIFGLPAIWNTMYLLKRKNNLLIYGPEGTKETVEKLLSADSRDVPFTIDVKELMPGNEFEIGNMPIKCAKAEHGVSALAYRLNAKDKSVVYTGDTSPSKHIEKLAKGSDLLIHDSTFLSDGDAEKYNHSTPAQAAKIAKHAEVGKLVLTHFSQKHKNPNDFLEQAQLDFENVILAEDLLTISL